MKKGCAAICPDGEFVKDHAALYSGIRAHNPRQGRSQRAKETGKPPLHDAPVRPTWPGGVNCRTPLVVRPPNLKLAKTQER